MTTSIPLPDGIFHEAERLAKRLKKSRSELDQQAVAEYAARHEPEAITDAMNDVTAQIDTRLDSFSSNAARPVRSGLSGSRAGGCLLGRPAR